MNNEPVAWMHKTYFPNGLYEEDLVWSKIDESSIPLYTHPANLTEDTECQYCKQGCIRCDARKLLTDKEIEQIGKEYGIKSVYQFAYYEFARAILKKASEK